MGLVASAMMGAWKTVGVKKGKAPRDENRGKLLALAELLYFANKRTMFYRGAYTRLLWSLGHWYGYTLGILVYVGYSGLLRAFWARWFTNRCLSTPPRPGNSYQYHGTVATVRSAAYGGIRRSTAALGGLRRLVAAHGGSRRQAAASGGQGTRSILYLIDISIHSSEI